jgi:hypothetical protein
MVRLQDGDGTGNTSLVYHARRLYALHEGDLPYAILLNRIYVYLWHLETRKHSCGYHVVVPTLWSILRYLAWICINDGNIAACRYALRVMCSGVIETLGRHTNSNGLQNRVNWQLQTSRPVCDHASENAWTMDSTISTAFFSHPRAP